jgi:hypothetical protein
MQLVHVALLVASIPPVTTARWCGEVSPTGTDTSQPSDTGADTGDSGPDSFPDFHPARSRRWRLVWGDDFDGAPCDPEVRGSCLGAADLARARDCFGSAAAPVATTVIHRFHPSENDPASFERRVIPHLGDLDKCTWMVSDHVNLIHFVGPAGPIAAYSPDAVSVAHGELRLTTRRSPGWTPALDDCGRVLDPGGWDAEHNRSKVCQYQAANVITYPMNGPAHAGDALGLGSGNGRLFERGGRLEVRGRAAGERGNMTAFWTWQHSEPESEYDLLEQFTNWHEMSSHGIVEYEPGNVGGAQARHLMDAAHKTNLYEELHTFGMEWQAGHELRYTLDHRTLHTFHDGDPAQGQNQCVDISIRGNPFYFILWNVLSDYSWAPEAAPVGAAQPPDSVYVDWIRYYEECPADSTDRACVESTLSPACPNPCDGVGYFDSLHCQVGVPPTGRAAAVSSRYFGYVPEGGGCPSGGVARDGLCALGAVPPGRSPFVYANHWYLQPVCSATAELANCGDPCPWKGTVYRDGQCFLAYAPPGSAPFVWDNQLYYAAVTGADPCPFGGQFDGANCRLGAPPPGSTAMVLNGAFYVRSDVCPDGGTFVESLSACRVHDLSAGSGAFVYAGGLYYDGNAGQCAEGGAWDSAHCYLGPAPVASEPFAWEGDLYLRARCLPATDWHGTEVFPGRVEVNGAPCP